MDDQEFQCNGRWKLKSCRSTWS